ncbi:hypothetical protein TNCV_2244241 [Trichonephila clavipes]|nr:hypothetical protein TNCV_2244241 [Trichonephila clavipes]
MRIIVLKTWLGDWRRGFGERANGEALSRAFILFTGGLVKVGSLRSIPLNFIYEPFDSRSNCPVHALPIMEENFIIFENKLYKQIKGLPQGGPASNSLANLYLHHYEIVRTLRHEPRYPHDPGNYSNDWLDQSAASYMLAGYSPQSFLIYFSDMGWRLASRAICPENVTVVTYTGS